MLSKFRPFDLPKFAFLIAIALIFFISLRPASDPDYGWHVVNGGHVVDGRIFNGKDIYSWTADGMWVAHEWLTEFFMNAVHTALGRPGNSVIAALIITATYCLVGATLRLRSVGWLLTSLSVLLCFSGALRSLAVRPHVVEMIGLAALAFTIDWFLAGRMSSRKFALFVFGAGVLWANSHGSFPLLIALLGITSVELVIAQDSRWKIIAIAGVIAGASFIFNPWGLHLYQFAVQSITSGPTLSHIQEWQAPVLNEWIAVPLIAQLVIALVGIVSVLIRPSAYPASPRVVGVLRAATFGILALQSGRHVMLFGIANAWIIAVGLRTLLSPLSIRSKNRATSQVSAHHELINFVGACAVGLAIGVAGWKIVSPEAQTRALAREYPVQLVQKLKVSFEPSDRLFNEYRWGGYLIETSSIPVFIDGRSELYGDRQLQRYASIIHLDGGFSARLDSLNITHVLMPGDSKLAKALSDNGWRVTATDSVGVILERNRH